MSVRTMSAGIRIPPFAPSCGATPATRPSRQPPPTVEASGRRRLPEVFLRLGSLRLLAQDVDGRPVRLVGGWNAAIERDQQQDLADLLRGAAVLERTLEMDAQLRRLSGRRHHGDHGEALGGERQARPAPDVALRVCVDDVLQRRAEIAERAGALLDRLRAEQ